MTQDPSSSVDWMLSNVKDVVGEQVQEASKASLDASQAVMEICRESALILRDRADKAFRAGMAVVEAGFQENFDQLNRIVRTKNVQDAIRLQRMWWANQTLAICHAFSKANGIRVNGDGKSGEAGKA